MLQSFGSTAFLVSKVIKKSLPARRGARKMFQESNTYEPRRLSNPYQLRNCVVNSSIQNLNTFQLITKNHLSNSCLSGDKKLK